MEQNVLPPKSEQELALASCRHTEPINTKRTIERSQMVFQKLPASKSLYKAQSISKGYLDSSCYTVRNCASEASSWLASSVALLTAPKFLHWLRLLLTPWLSQLEALTLGPTFSAAAESSPAPSLHSPPLHWCRQDNYSKVKINLSPAYGGLRQSRLRSEFLPCSSGGFSRHVLPQ